MQVYGYSSHFDTLPSVTFDHKTMIFSGGEVQVAFLMKQISGCVAFQIEAHLATANDILELMMLKDALDRLANGKPIRLVIPYVPYARQDRVMNQGEALSIKVFADLINRMNFDRVVVWDPHSDVTAALIDRIHVIPVEDLFGGVPVRDCPVPGAILVAPDAGAIKKVSKVAKKANLEMVRADKTRSVIDGKITGTVVYADHVGDRDFVIVDDICDGGRTFIELGKELRKLTNGKVYLWVTHGIFSQGLEPFRGIIDHIYTAAPFPNVVADPSILTVVSRFSIANR